MLLRGRGGQTRSHALFIIWWFPYVSKYTGRQLNVNDSGKIVLLTTTSVKNEELPRVTRFRLFYTDMVSCGMHSITQYGPKCNCASRKQQNYYFKRKVHENT